METSKTFGKVKVVRASALAQMEVLSLLSGNVVAHWSQLSEPLGNPVEDFLLPFVLGLPFSHKRKLIELLMSELTTKEGEYLDEESYNGKMIEYHRLLAEVLYWNLNDFFTYIDNVHRKDLSKLKSE